MRRLGEREVLVELAVLEAQAPVVGPGPDRGDHRQDVEACGSGTPRGGVDQAPAEPGVLGMGGAALAERERRVLTLCREHGVPVATVIGGGYDDDRPALARRHALVVEAAHQLWRQ